MEDAATRTVCGLAPYSEYRNVLGVIPVTVGKWMSVVYSHPVLKMESSWLEYWEVGASPSLKKLPKTQAGSILTSECRFWFHNLQHAKQWQLSWSVTPEHSNFPPFRSTKPPLLLLGEPFLLPIHWLLLLSASSWVFWNSRVSRILADSQPETLPWMQPRIWFFWASCPRKSRKSGWWFSECWVVVLLSIL